MHSQSFFNVTIKSQPTRVEPEPVRVERVVVETQPVRVERPLAAKNGYYKGISEWSERKQEEFERCGKP